MTPFYIPLYARVSCFSCSINLMNKLISHVQHRPNAATGVTDCIIRNNIGTSLTFHERILCLLPPPPPPPQKTKQNPLVYFVLIVIWCLFQVFSCQWGSCSAWGTRDRTPPWWSRCCVWRSD